ncbi:MAG: helix-turn-helix domain-containing protein [Gammaproteobacteria bacterium]
MNLQTIKSVSGQDEYVLLPMNTYRILKKQIDQIIEHNNDYEKFELTDYIQNPLAIARINAYVTQEELADYLGVSQAYISKIENQNTVSPKLRSKIQLALENLKKKI